MPLQPLVSSQEGIYFRSCNFCSSQDFRVFKRIERAFPTRIYGNHDLSYPNIGEVLKLQYLECLKCGLIGINPLTKFTDINRRSFDGERNIVAWNDVEYQTYESDKTNIIRILYDQYSLESYRKQNRILDVSCGPGVSLRWLRDQKKWEVFGVDPDLHSVRMANNLYGLNIVNGLIDDVGTPDEYFDLIIMDNSLEHTFNPLETMLTAFRMLRKGGGLLIFVPNSEGLSTTFLDANSHWGHWFFYSPKVLTKMLSRIGYEIPRLIAIQNPVNPELEERGVNIDEYRDDLVVDLNGADKVNKEVETRKICADYFNLIALKPISAPVISSSSEELLLIARNSMQELKKVNLLSNVSSMEEKTTKSLYNKFLSILPWGRAGINKLN